jgi:hypothetical protein
MRERTPTSARRRRCGLGWIGGGSAMDEARGLCHP